MVHVTVVLFWLPARGLHMQSEQEEDNTGAASSKGMTITSVSLNFLFKWIIDFYTQVNSDIVLKCQTHSKKKKGCKGFFSTASDSSSTDIMVCVTFIQIPQDL